MASAGLMSCPECGADAEFVGVRQDSTGAKYEEFLCVSEQHVIYVPYRSRMTFYVVDE